MRVLVITGSYPPMMCGVGDYTSKIVYELSKNREIEVFVITSKSSHQANKKNIFSIMDTWGITELYKLIDRIKNISPDVIHIQYPTQGYGNKLLPYFLPIIARMFVSNIVQTWHEIYRSSDFVKVFLKTLVKSSIVVVRPQYLRKTDNIIRFLTRKNDFHYFRSASSIDKSRLTEIEKLEKRKELVNGRARLIVFFGFLYPKKGVDLLFRIANHEKDKLLIIGDLESSSSYLLNLKETASLEGWGDNVSFSGYLLEKEVSNILAVADAVVLPFKDGGGEWNSSINAAVNQGTFVLTTSEDRTGYFDSENIYYAPINDVECMKKALDIYSGKKIEIEKSIDLGWKSLSESHIGVYSCKDRF